MYKKSYVTKSTTGFNLERREESSMSTLDHSLDCSLILFRYSFQRHKKNIPWLSVQQFLGSELVIQRKNRSLWQSKTFQLYLFSFMTRQTACPYRCIFTRMRCCIIILVIFRVSLQYVFSCVSSWGLPELRHSRTGYIYEAFPQCVSSHGPLNCLL